MAWLQVAAPLDALQTRADVNEMLEGQHRSIWRYAIHKLHEIGLRGVFAGYGFSLAKVYTIHPVSSFLFFFYFFPM